MTLAVVGAGAFGTALAIALAREGQPVLLYCRDEQAAETMQASRMSGERLPGHALPDSLEVTWDIARSAGLVTLLAVPMQSLADALHELPAKTDQLVACCKGIDKATGLGPVETIESVRPTGEAAVLTGPSFAADIARGLPTALVLAARSDELAARLQADLTRHTLRLYRTTDVTGAELGGALKNVVALAAGITIGAGLGDSARASVIARGFSEMTRFAVSKGAIAETLNGLSGLGDLVLTCTSEKSRNFTAGIALGAGGDLPTETTEGLATSGPVSRAAKEMSLDLPLIQAVADVVAGDLDIDRAIATLLARPVGKE